MELSRARITRHTLRDISRYMGLIVGADSVSSLSTPESGVFDTSYVHG
jgi:hypothetical protein